MTKSSEKWTFGTYKDIEYKHTPNSEFYDNTDYNIHVREYIKALDAFEDRHGHYASEQLKCMGHPKVSPEGEVHMNLLQVLDKYCRRFNGEVLFTKKEIIIAEFIELYPMYERIDLDKALREIRRLPWMNIYIMYCYDSGYPPELLDAQDREFIKASINEYFETEIYPTTTTQSEHGKE